MPIKVLMVCLGNICRSPLAEGIMASKVDPSRIQVESAGTAGYHIGNPPDPRSIEVAASKGIDISRQRCRRFSSADFDNYDYIFAMDRENLIHLQQLTQKQEHLEKLNLLLEAAGARECEVPDPYYGGKQGFQNVFQMLDEACGRLTDLLMR